MSRITSTSEVAPARTNHGFFSSTTIQPLFWRPRFHPCSPVQLHAPLLFLLAADERVQQIGVLGANDGFAHFLFCQTIDKHNSLGRCVGFGFWKDEESGATRTLPPASLREHAKHFYKGISDIRSSANMAEAVEGIAEQSLDLLFVDLNAIAEDDPPHVEDLTRLLRSNASLVIHGTNAQRKQTYSGVVLEKQLSQLNRLDFQDGAGLSVLPIGENQPIGLSSLLAARQNGKIPDEIQLVFRRIGQGLVSIEEARSLKSKVTATRACLAAAEAEGELQAQKAQQVLKTEKTTRFEETATLTQIAEELRARLQATKAECDAALKAKREMQEQNKRILGSISWRITVPLRALKRVFVSTQRNLLRLSYFPKTGR